MVPENWLFAIHPTIGDTCCSSCFFGDVRRTAIKIWNNTRNEKKLEQISSCCLKARMAALTSQINPHFLFNTLNSVSSLIRIDPDLARSVVYWLSSILRRLLRKPETSCRCARSWRSSMIT